MDDGSFLAAGIAWYALLSFFPIVLIGMSVLGYLVPPGEAVERHSLEMAKVMLPQNLMIYVQQTLSGLNQDRGHLGVVGLLTLLWSGRHLFRAMELSIHRAWEIPVKRSYIRGNILCMVMILLCGGVTCGVVLATGALSWLEVLLSQVSIPHPATLSLDQTMLWSWVHSWVVIPTASLLIFFLLYLLLPTRQVPVLAALPGAILGAVLQRLASWLYVRCLGQLVSLNPLYASIGTFAGLMAWVYLSAVIFVLGAEMVDIIDREFYSQGAARTKPARRRSAALKAGNAKPKGAS